MAHEAEGDDAMRMLRHDIRNQLSNINLAAEQLRYEIEEGGEDSALYLDMIITSCKNINNMLAKDS